MLRKGRLQTGGITTTSDLEPIGRAVQNRHLLKRSAASLFRLEGDDCGLWIAQRQPDGVIAFGSTDIHDQARLPSAGLFHHLGQLPFINTEQLGHVGASNRIRHVAHPRKRTEPHSATGSLSHKVREIPYRAVALRNEAADK